MWYGNETHPTSCYRAIANCARVHTLSTVRKSHALNGSSALTLRKSHAFNGSSALTVRKSHALNGSSALTVRKSHALNGSSALSALNAVMQLKYANRIMFERGLPHAHVHTVYQLLHLLARLM